MKTKENIPISYAEAMSELETIVTKLQSNQCEIDQLQPLVTRALVLIKQCKQQLFTTDNSLKEILKELEQ